jgi:hypothetical protein
MRIHVLIPLLALGACNVNNDPANDQLSVEYNQQRIEEGTAAAARTARDVGSSVANVAVSTGRAVSNEVGDIDVDVDVSRNKAEGERAGNGNAQ